jgi:hypothetical protein
MAARTTTWLAGSPSSNRLHAPSRSAVGALNSLNSLNSHLATVRNPRFPDAVVQELCRHLPSESSETEQERIATTRNARPQ